MNWRFLEVYVSEISEGFNFMRSLVLFFRWRFSKWALSELKEEENRRQMVQILFDRKINLKKWYNR